MTIINENVTGGETATMTCGRWPIPGEFTGAHAAGLALAGSCAPVAILTHQPSIDAKSAWTHVAYQMTPVGQMVRSMNIRGMDVSGTAKGGDVVAIDPDATDKKFDTRLGLKTWSPPPV